MSKIAKQVNPPTQKKVLDLARKSSILRPRDLQEKGLPSDYLWRLHKQGKLEKVGRGMYAAQDAKLSEYETVVQAALRVPHGVVCLLSALRFHSLTTQAPFEVWLAIDRRARLPRVEHPPLRIVRFPAEALAEGVAEHKVEGVPVRVTTPARTVVDCFAYRNKIGLDVALEALRDCWRRRRATMDELHRAARARRMTNVMRPYLEALA